MKLFEAYSYLSGYKINISKTQVLAFNYIPPKAIQESYDLNWNLKSIKYLGVMISKNISDLYRANYDNLNQDIKKYISRWSTLPLDLNSRIEIVKLNVLPKCFYLFQSLPVEVPQGQFINWDRMISRFVWGGKRPRVRYKTLQLPKERGGMGFPKLMEYYYAAQLRPIYCCCKSEFRAKWKDMENEVNQIPIQSMIHKLYKELKTNMGPITVHKWDLWFKVLKIYKIQNDANIIKWVAYDGNFKPAKYDHGFKQWVAKGTRECNS